MLIALLEDAFDFVLARAIFEMIEAAGFAPLIVKKHVAALDRNDDAVRHTAIHVLFASDIDRTFLSTKLSLIKSKDPSRTNRELAAKMLTHLLVVE